MDAVPYNDLFQYTAAADIGWLLINKKSISNKFALPNKLFEYILMGIPIVSSNIKNITDSFRETYQLSKFPRLKSTIQGAEFSMDGIYYSKFLLLLLLSQDVHL